MKKNSVHPASSNKIADSAESLSSVARVRVYEKELKLPAYRVGVPELMPCWGRSLLNGCYPYTMFDKLTTEKYERTYRAVFVENEWVRALVLPEIGGRLHGAEDKTNGYQFFYDQRVIKPGLVGLTGAWIPGGIEWNFPHGHRPSGFRDTDWCMKENPDGSCAVWTGEIERITGMRWAVGATVHPGRNWVETRVRLYNCTPFAHAFAYWATSGVRVTPEFKIVKPGNIVTSHYKMDYFHWPVNNGLDLSCWKNTPGHMSYFACESEEDYFGCYSPEERAGMVHVADHHIVRGKKIWTWGTSHAGRIWEDILSDGDLPYMEPQAGAYSDNQPDFHWIQPGETKTFTHFWFPVRDIGVWDYANLEGALSLKKEGNKVEFGWSPTGVNAGAEVIVTSKGEEIFRRKIDSTPANPFVAETEVRYEGTDITELEMTVLSPRGEEMLKFRHPKPSSFQELRTKPPYEPPEEMKSQDELFVAGDHMEKFLLFQESEEYYAQGLKRDPLDVRINTAVGLLRLKEGKFRDAAEHFRSALERQSSFAKARYYYGLAQLFSEEPYEAEKALNRASYDHAFYGAAHFELALLAASQCRMDRALEHIERSLEADSANSEYRGIRAILLNRLGRHEEALLQTLNVREKDPLDMLSLAEQVVALDALGREREADAARKNLLEVTRKDSENHIELAIRYARCGLMHRAHDILELIIGKENSKNSSQQSIQPMVYYYLAFYAEQTGKTSLAACYREYGSRACPDYCFPNRIQDESPLRYAIEKNPSDSRPLYFLGNLLYSQNRTSEAIDCWRKAIIFEPDNFVALRNLGYAFRDLGDLEQARLAYESAVETNPDRAILAIFELDDIYALAGQTVKERIAHLEKYMDQLRSWDYGIKRLVSLYVRAGRYMDALGWMDNFHFHNWELKYDIHQYWTEANIRQGHEEFEAGRFEKAFERYRLAITYPVNLEVGEQPDASHARERYYSAEALERLGRKEEARKELESVSAEVLHPAHAFQYFRGKALEKLSRKDEAHSVYHAMLDELDSNGIPRSEFIITERNQDPERNVEAILLWRRSLALEGIGREEDACIERQRARSLDPVVEFRVFSPPRAGWHL